MTQYLIIGNGVAGTTAAENIRKNDPDGRITIVTEEDLPFYYRIRLPEVIAGKVDETALIAKKSQWYANQGIDLMTGTRITDIDTEKKSAITDQGDQFPYDSLLIATGSHSFLPPLKGAEKRGVFTLRNMQDVREISEFAQKIDTVLLIGGGLLGLETGHALNQLGKKIKVVEFFPRLLPRQLDKNGADRLQKIFEVRGFSFHLGAVTKEITGNETVDGVLLESDKGLDAQMVIVAAGVRPNLKLAQSLDLACDKGIQVDRSMRTTRPEIFAAGDVAEFNGIVYGIWPAALEQGKVAGTNMAGGREQYNGTTMANILKVAGIDLAAAGEIDADNNYTAEITADDTTYRKIVLDEGKIIGCIMLGNIKGFQEVTRAIAERKGLDSIAL